MPAERQGTPTHQCLADGDPDGEVQVAWQRYQQLRAAYRAKDTTEGKRSAVQILEMFTQAHTFPGRPSTSPPQVPVGTRQQRGAAM